MEIFNKIRNKGNFKKIYGQIYGGLKWCVSGHLSHSSHHVLFSGIEKCTRLFFSAKIEIS